MKKQPTCFSRWLAEKIPKKNLLNNLGKFLATKDFIGGLFSKYGIWGPYPPPPYEKIGYQKKQLSQNKSPPMRLFFFCLKKSPNEKRNKNNF